MFTLYSHDDEHSLYHTITEQLVTDWKVEDPIADLLNIEITQSKDGKVKLAQTSQLNREARRHALPGWRGIAISPDGEDTVRRVPHQARRRRAL